MPIISPLTNVGPYIEQHERWYLSPVLDKGAAGPNSNPPSFRPINAAVAHERFLRNWARDLRRTDARSRRDARGQFLAQWEEI